jgi:hypothetical protein
VALDDTSPTSAADASNNSAGPGSRNDSFGDQPNWMPLNDHGPAQAGDQGTEVQRTLQGLAIGSVPTANYGPGDLNSNSYGNSDSSNAADTGLSPDTGHSASNRPTPNSTTPSDTRPSLLSGQNTSDGPSYQTSPVTSHQRVPVTDGRSMSSFFTTQPDYSNIPATGFTPDNAFTMPETPGKDFSIPSGWEMSAQTTGLTPVGEGVFRHLMELGPMDPMDLGWEGSS